MEMAASISDLESTLLNFTSNKNLSELRTSLKLVRTMFGEVTEKNVTFCLDTSGSMYRVFSHYREHLLETLLKMFLANANQKFNVVLFNSSVHSFSNRHQNCDHQNILKLIKWINKPFYESKSNVMGGLIKSFEDYPDAVYLVTDGFVNKKQNELLNNLPHISKGRPVRCIMVTHKIPPDNTALDFLEDIASITNGTLTIISIRTFGSVEVLLPILYEIRPPGTRRSTFSPFGKEALDSTEIKKYFPNCKCCSIKKPLPPTLIGDPMTQLPVIAPFLSKDPISGRCCPFYHPFYHWYWPQYWDEKGTSSLLLWTKYYPHAHSILKDFRDSRSFICGKKYLDSYNDVCNSVSAGIVLINRKVLCLNYRDNNKIYLGKVMSQINPMEFVVQFNIYEEFDEIQNTHLSDIIDLEDQKRHSIKVNDYVLAPLNSIDGPYEIGIVLDGIATRSGNDSLLPLRNSKLQVQILESKVTITVKSDQAIYLSQVLKERIENRQSLSNNNDVNKKSHEDSDNENDNNENPTYMDNNNNSIKDVHDECNNELVYCNLCLKPCDICCGCSHRNCKLVGRVASPVDNGKAKTLEEIDKEIENRKTKSNETEISCSHDAKSISIDKEDNFTDEEKDEDLDEDQYEKSTNKYEFDSNDNMYNFLNKTDKFTETDLNWCILRILNKQKNISEVNNKKIWKYWGRKGIPDVIDPPSTEPYNDPPNWGGCPVPKNIINPVEWPNTAFQTINPHVVTDYSPNKMYQVFHEECHKPSPKPKRDAACGRSGLSQEEYARNIYDKRFKYLQGGYPKMEIKYPYIDSVKPLLSSWSSINNKENNLATENCLRSIEKSRINAQIRRDEANSLNFLHHQTKDLRKLTPLK